MADRETRIRITADDEASQVFSAVGRNAGRELANLGRAGQDVDRLGDKFSKLFESMGKAEPAAKRLDAAVSKTSDSFRGWGNDIGTVVSGLADATVQAGRLAGRLATLPRTAFGIGGPIAAAVAVGATGAALIRQQGDLKLGAAYGDAGPNARLKFLEGQELTQFGIKELGSAGYGKVLDQMRQFRGGGSEARLEAERQLIGDAIVARDQANAQAAAGRTTADEKRAQARELEEKQFGGIFGLRRRSRDETARAQAGNDPVALAVMQGQAELKRARDAGADMSAAFEKKFISDLRDEAVEREQIAKVNARTAEGLALMRDLERDAVGRADDLIARNRTLAEQKEAELVAASELLSMGKISKEQHNRERAFIDKKFAPKSGGGGGGPDRARSGVPFLESHYLVGHGGGGDKLAEQEAQRVRVAQLATLGRTEKHLQDVITAIKNQQVLQAQGVP